MHPKAAYLALHGATPMIFTSMKAYNLKSIFRIKWCPIKADENQLKYSPVMEKWLMEVGAYFEDYTEITWEEISDEILDLLTWELIHSFVNNHI